MDLKDFHGIVSKCHCTNPATPMNCKTCFARGFTAICLQCSGKGQVTVPVAGAATGEMKSTCDKCGGMGAFGVPKPANWDAEHAPKVEASVPDPVVDDDAAFHAATAGAVAEATVEQIEQAQATTAADPMMTAFREMQSEGAELKRPTTIHHMKWKKMTHQEKVEAIERESKPVEELVTA